MNKFVTRGAAASVLLVPLLSQAAIDSAAAVTAVTDAQGAQVTVLGALIGMAAAIFGLWKVYGMLNRK